MLSLFVAASEARSELAAAPLKCKTSIVGGGWAGVYTAWRLVVDSAAAKPGDVCLFEARSEVGGRTYSTAIDGMVLDIGAYRFGMHMHLPADLITKKFELNTTCYEPSCAPDPEFNTTLYRIVDASGHNAGYATAVHLMTKQLTEAGVRIFYQYQLTGIYDAGAAGGSMLHFAGGALAQSSAVLLNLPRAAIERLDPASNMFENRAHAQVLRNCTPCDGGPDIAVKVYAFYDDPWWITKLGLTEGDFASTTISPPLVGRYHDGPVVHDKQGKPVGPGALQAVYTYSAMHPEIDWYVPFARDPAEDPLTVTTDSALLGPLHTRLMAFHKSAFAAKGLNASDVPMMSKVALGVWPNDKLAALTNPASALLANQIKGHSTTCPREECLNDVTPVQYNALVGQPSASRNIHIANNDYAWTLDQSVPCCWAEQGLKAAERSLHKAWGLTKPAWLDEAYWEQLIVA